MDRQRIIFAVSGASGMPLALSVLKNIFSNTDIEIHLVVSKGACLALREECNMSVSELEKFAHAIHNAQDMAAPLASGSWRHSGMIVCPCSMASLAAIATGAGTTLVHRASDVCLKERLPLVLVPRETPLSLIHIRNMAAATEAGTIIMPFMPAFYTGDNSMASAMRHFTGRLLQVLRIPNNLCKGWKEEQTDN